MDENEQKLPKKNEVPDSWWYRVYFGVIVSTILVIFALWAFSQYFK